MTPFNPNYFIHAANLLLVVAYSVRDIMWLRLFAVASSLISLPYFVLQPTPQWAPITWSLLFAALNLVQSFRLYLERRPVKLTADEEEVGRLAFPGLPARKVLQLVSLGAWTTAEFPRTTTTLAAGELLVLYTDGVTDTRGPTGRFGTDRLAEVLAGATDLEPDEIANRVDAALLEFEDGAQRDDVALLVLQATGAPASAPTPPAVGAPTADRAA